MYTFDEIQAVDSEIAEAIQRKTEPEYRADRIRKLCK